MSEKNGVFDEINDLLTNAMQQYVPYAYKPSLVLFKRLKLTTCCERMYCDHGDLFYHFLKAMSSKIEILEFNDLDTVIFLMGSGFYGLNPVFIGIKSIDKDVYIMAMAKEGLINQKTAPKAVAEVKSINENGLDGQDAISLLD